MRGSLVRVQLSAPKNKKEGSGIKFQTLPFYFLFHLSYEVPDVSYERLTNEAKDGASEDRQVFPFPEANLSN